ncbi:MAG: hypothetical protein AAF490_03110 [Chloroflexota bacterium]
MAKDFLDDNAEYETTETDEASPLATIWRILYIFIVFVIIMGLISPSVLNILSGWQTSNRLGPSDVAPIPPAQSDDSAAVETEVAESNNEPETEEIEEEIIEPDITEDNSADENVIEEADQTLAEDEIVEQPEALINRIAFITIDQQVATIDPDGSNVVILTSGDANYQFPAWSPDGQFLASISTSGGQGSISIIEDNQSANPKEIYSSSSEPPFYLYWSPDSQFISFLAENLDTPMALHLLDIEGNAQDAGQKIATGGPFYWNWGADSQSILVHSGAAGANARLEFIAPSGELQREDIAPPGLFQVPALSANGRYMAYAALDGRGTSSIVIEDLQTAEMKSFEHEGLTALSWSPSADQLAYISTSNPEIPSFVGPLRLLDADTGEETLLTDSFVLAYFWSPNGQYIAYFTLVNENRNEFNARLFEQIMGRGPALSKQAGQFDLPDFELTIVDVGTGVGQIVMTDFVPSFTFISQFMPFFDQYALSHSLWSPTSDAFLVPYLEDNLPKIAIVTPEGSQPRELTDGRIAFWSHQ